MDWNAAINKNREALKRILAMLVAMAGLGNRQSAIVSRQSGSAQAADGSTDCLLPTAYCRLALPRHLHRAVLRLLRPAEAAVRRLVIVMARGLVVELPPARPRQPQPGPVTLRNGVGTGILMPRGFRPEPGLRPPARRTFSLSLLDPLPRRRTSGRPAASGVPRISFPGFIAPHPVAVRRPPSPNDPVDAARLALRLEALASALDDLPGQARRFARWRAARDAVGAQDKKPRDRTRFRRIWPLRPGRPPGGRRRPAHEVHEVLRDLQWFAVKALERTDTS
jgi:hypothetical protein